MIVDTPLDNGEQIPGAGMTRIDGALDRAAAALPSEDLPITLAFEDLLPDANGEIVVTGADLGTQLNIVTDQRICAEGVAESHVTAGGLDVAGLAFFAFEGGTRLYYSAEIEVTIAPLHG